MALTIDTHRPESLPARRPRPAARQPITVGPAQESASFDLSSSSVERLSGWGRTSPVRCEVVRPRHARDVDDVVVDRQRVIARGCGRSYGDAAQAVGGTVVDTIGLDRIIAFDAHVGTVTVDAGVSLDRLMRFVVPRGWFVAVTPGTRQVSVGGAIAADVHGKNHHRDGSFGQHVSAVTLRTGRGVEHLSPDGTPTAFWATAGGMGLTGVITSATLQLRPIETPLMASTTERYGDLATLMDALRAADATSSYTVAWIDTLNTGRRLGRGLVITAEHATRREVEARRPDLVDATGEFVTRSWRLPELAVPVLNPTLGKVFNRAWYRINRPGERLDSISNFFHPLDAIANWNLLYGRRGFVQWQIAIPDSASWLIECALGQLADIGAGSFLSVLKRFGPANDGPLSFPIGGWTLAVDIPAGVAGLAATLDRLDRLTAGAGGRIYLAKDARLDPELVATMYPRLDEWRAVRNDLDPNDVFASDLSRRLRLTHGRPSSGRNDRLVTSVCGPGAGR